MTQDIYFRGTPQLAGEQVNDLFEHLGLGRPISPDDTNGHITAVIIDEKLVGAAYAAAATSIADAFFMNGRGMAGVLTALRVHAVEAIAVLPEFRGQGHGTTLVKSIINHARQDFDADHLLARIDAADAALQRWWTNRRFNLCSQSESLTFDGVPLATADGYLDAWRPLSRSPRITVAARTMSFVTSTTPSTAVVSPAQARTAHVYPKPPHRRSADRRRTA